MSISSLTIAPFYTHNREFLDQALVHLQSLVDQKIAKVVTSQAFGFTLLEFGSKARASEDRNYSKHSDFWTYVRRGTLLILNQENEVIETRCGPFKFGYEEDAYHCPVPREQGVSELYTEKENGENFKLAAFTYHEAAYWIFASKNVHMLVRRGHELEDMVQYSHDPKDRHLYAMIMAKVFLRQKLDFSRIFDYLQATSYSLIGEACMTDYQHLVQYEQDTIFFYAFTVYDAPEGGLVLNPYATQDGLKNLGLQVVRNLDSVRLDAPEMRTEIREKYMRQENSEGAVVYVLDAADRVIFVYKHKNMEYIPDRAVREQMRKPTHCVAAIQRRLDTLHCKDEIRDFPERVRLALTWYAYWVLELEATPNVFSQWVTYKAPFNQLSKERQNEYLQRLRQVQPDEKEDKVDPDAVKSSILHAQPPPGQLRLILVGIPGSGKTTLGKSLEALGQGRYADKDQTGTKDPKVFNRLINELSKDPNLPSLILGKCHHNLTQRKQTLSALDKETPGRLVYVKMVHPQGTRAMVELCLERIHDRGDKHQTLTPYSADLEGVLHDFSASYEHITHRERGSDELLLVDMTLTPAEQVKFVLQQLREDVDEDQISAAVVAADAYERGIVHVSPTSFWGVMLTDASLLATFAHEVVAGLLVQQPQLKSSNRMHSTMHYFGGKNKDLSLEEPYRRLEGKEVKIKVKGLYYTERVACLEVEKSFPCQNQFAHITLALAAGSRPAESNGIIQDFHGENVGGVKYVPLELEVTGVVKRE